MAEKNTQTPEEAREGLAKLRKIRAQIESTRAKEAALTKDRDQLIFQLASRGKGATAVSNTQLHKASGVSISYISRIIKDKGAPRSGSAVARGSVAKGVLSRRRTHARS